MYHPGLTPGSDSDTERLRYAGDYLALLLNLGVPPAVGEQGAFMNGQSASLVLGQPDFTTGAATTGRCSAYTIINPSGIAVDSTTGKVFVVDSGNHRVLRFASVASLALGAAAEAVFGQHSFSADSPNTGGLSASSMYFPTRVAIDSAGRLWVCDSVNNRVLRFDNAAVRASGAVADGVLGQPDFTTSTPNTGGRSASSMHCPQGIAVDCSGRVWVTDVDNHRVLWFDNAASKANGARADGVLGQSDFVTGACNARGLSARSMFFPTGVAVDSAFRLWVVDSSNNRVLRFDAAAGKANGGTADGVLGQPDFVTSSPSTSACSLAHPASVVVGEAGCLWVADYSNHRVLWFDNAASKVNGARADGVLGQPDVTSFQPNAGSSPSANTLYGPVDLAVDSVGRLWVADADNSRVLMFCPATASLSV
ncbi:MAG: hypothetical protein RLZZ387_4740 [Chloroflexota bacterium]